MKTSEFLERWKKGIQSITPYQQTKITLFSNLLIIIGICIGLYATFNAIWWLFIILLGSFGISIIQILGNIQKFLSLREIARQLEEAQKLNLDRRIDEQKSTI